MPLFGPAWTPGAPRRVPVSGVASSSATPAPDAVVAVADVPAVSVLISATVAATVAAAVAAVGAPALQTGVTVTPSAVAAVAAIPTPLAGPPAHNESVFTGLTPAVGDAADATAYTLGTLITSDADASIIGVRWYFPTVTISGTVIGLVYSYDSESAGTELARANFVSPTLGDWNTAIFASPVAMTAATKYVAAIWTPLRYVYTLNGLDSAVVNGHLTAPANQAGVQRNGRLDFASSTTDPAYPAAGGGTNYFVDLLVLFGDPVTATATPAVVAGVAAVDAPTVATSSGPVATAAAAVAAVGTATLHTSSTVTPTVVAAVAAVGTPGGPGSEVHLYTNQTPTGQFSDGPYTLGTLVTCDVDATATGVRWYAPSTLPGGAVTGHLYSYDSENSGTLLASGTFGTLTADTWNTVTFGTPAAITAAAKYVWAIRTPDRYVATAGQFGSAVVNGHLTGPADVDPGQRNGRYDVASSGTVAAYPQFGAGAGYFVDPLVLVGNPVHATVTPSAVAGVAAVGSVLAGNTTLVTPSAVAAVAAVGAPVVTTSSRVTAVAVAAVGAVGGFDGVVIDVTVTPTAVAAVGAVGTVTLAGDVIVAVTPSAVTAVAAVGAPTITYGWTVSPATVAAVAAIAQPTIGTGFDVATSTTTVATRRTSVSTVTARRTSTAPVTARRTSVATVGGE